MTLIGKTNSLINSISEKHTAYQYQRHVLSHAYDQCDLCDHKFERPAGREFTFSSRDHAWHNHRVKNHASELNMLMCDICGMGFYRQHNLEAHQARHVDDKGNFSDKIVKLRNFCCEYCPFVSNSAQHLRIDSYISYLIT